MRGGGGGCWGGDGACKECGEGRVDGVSAPRVLSLWVTPKIFGVAFKILQHAGMQLKFLTIAACKFIVAGAGL